MDCQAICLLLLYLFVTGPQKQKLCVFFKLESKSVPTKETVIDFHDRFFSSIIIVAFFLIRFLLRIIFIVFFNFFLISFINGFIIGMNKLQRQPPILSICMQKLQDEIGGGNALPPDLGLLRSSDTERLVILTFSWYRQSSSILFFKSSTSSELSKPSPSGGARDRVQY